MTKQIRRRAPTKEPTGNLRIIVNLLRRKRRLGWSLPSAWVAVAMARKAGFPVVSTRAEGAEAIDWRHERGCPMHVPEKQCR
jgi:hypothetical protein